MAKNLTLKKPGSPVEKLVNEMSTTSSAKPVAKKESNVKVNASVKPKSKVNVNVKGTEKQEESIPSLLRPREEKEIKSRPVNIRVKESVFADFEYLRRKLKYSQSDFFEVMVKYTKEQVLKWDEEMKE